MNTHIEPTNPEISNIDEPKKSNRKITISVKTARIIAVVIIFGALAFYFKGLLIVATVNGSPISRFALIHKLEKASGKSTLNALITQKLLDDAATKKGIIVSADEVNTEIAKAETQVKSQGQTLDTVLAGQGMTLESFKHQILMQKKLEKLLGDKIHVTDEEAQKFITDSNVVIPKGEEEKYKEQAKEQLKQKKLNNTAQAFIESLHSDASIRYFVNY